MNIHGIGIDLVEIPRFREVMKRHGEAFMRRVFTRDECDCCDTRKDSAPSYAARFAAKEAVSKAFGTGIGAAMAFTEIEVVSGESSEPTVKLHGAALAFAEKLGVLSIRLSLTHTENYAAANALVVTRA